MSCFHRNCYLLNLPNPTSLFWEKTPILKLLPGAKNNHNLSAKLSKNKHQSRNETVHMQSAGCEDGLIPHGGVMEDLSDPRDMERHNEEVRLLYVGMTRAKHQLYLLHARTRALRGGMQRSNARMSPFLESLSNAEQQSSPSKSDRSHLQQRPQASGRYTAQSKQTFSRNRPMSNQAKKPPNNSATSRIGRAWQAAGKQYTVEPEAFTTRAQQAAARRKSR